MNTPSEGYCYYTFTSFPSSSLLGPRRKISLAIAELKEQDDTPNELAPAASSSKSAPEVRGGGGVGEEGVGAERESGVVRGRGRVRPPLYKQPSTELQAAYHQVNSIPHDV